MLTALACGGGAADLTGYTATVQSWVGHDGNTLVRTWGPPASMFTMPSGNTTYVYMDTTSISAGKQLECRDGGSGNTASCWVSGEQVFTFECQTQFEVDPQQKVVFARADGVRCLTAYPPPGAAAGVAGAVPAAVDAAAPVAPSPVAPSPVAPSPVAPSPVAPSPVAPSPDAPAATAPSPTATSTPAPVLREVRPGAINARRAEMKQAREEKRKAAKAE